MSASRDRDRDSDLDLEQRPYVQLLAVELVDPDGYATYRRAMLPLLHEHGGDFELDVCVSENLGAPRGMRLDRVFSIRFPSAEASRRFYADSRYRAVRAAHFGPAVRRLLRLGTVTVPELTPSASSTSSPRSPSNG